MFPLRLLIKAFFLFGLTGCFHPQLRVRKELFGPSALPSQQLKTPDISPGQSGERLIAQWNLPKGQWQGAILIAQWRLANATVQTHQMPLERKKSYWEHLLKGREYSQCGGIDSFSVKILRKGALIAQSTHPMWICPVPTIAN